MRCRLIASRTPRFGTLQAKDPTTGQIIPERVAQILAEPKNYKLAQQMLGKYKSAKTDVLQLMKEKIEQVSTLPKTLKQSGLPPAPEMPEQVDPRALKAAALRQSAEGLRSMKGIRGSLDVVALVHALMGNPTSLLYPPVRRVLSYGLESPRVMNYLTEPSAEELQMLKPSNVYPNKAAAMAAIKGQGGGEIPPSGNPRPTGGIPPGRGNKPATRVAPGVPRERRSPKSSGKPPATGERRTLPMGNLKGPPPEQSRLVLEYTRRMNDPRATPEERLTLRKMIEAISGTEGGLSIGGGGEEMAKQIREARQKSSGRPISKGEALANEAKRKGKRTE
jgi:hypothetical protein